MILAAQAVPCGRLRITAPGDIGIHFLSPFITQFARRYPKVQVDVMLTQRVVDLVADEYIYGRISRVSREATVLILDYDDTPSDMGAYGGTAEALGSWVYVRSAPLLQ